MKKYIFLIQCEDGPLVVSSVAKVVAIVRESLGDIYVDGKTMDIDPQAFEELDNGHWVPLKDFISDHDWEDLSIPERRGARDYNFSVKRLPIL